MLHTELRIAKVTTEEGDLKLDPPLVLDVLTTPQGVVADVPLANGKTVQCRGENMVDFLPNLNELLYISRCKR